MGNSNDWTIVELHAELSKGIRGKESGADSIVTMCNTHAELLRACRYALSVLDSIPNDAAEAIMDILDEEIDTGLIREAIYKATGK